MLKNTALLGSLLGKFQNSQPCVANSFSTLFLRGVSTQLDSNTKSLPVYNLDFEQVGTTSIPADIFGVEVRKDILHRVVRWQQAKAQKGTHLTKGRSDVRGGGRKPHAQKGTGNARAGTIRAPQMRGGGVVHGPVLRSHEHSLPKKVRRLGLKCALSAKLLEERLLILDSMALEDPKTKVLDQKLQRFFEPTKARPSALLIDSNVKTTKAGQNLMLAASNLWWVDVLPPEGLNVYSILRRGHLMLTQEALGDLVTRFRTPVFRGPLDRARLRVQEERLAATA